MLAAEVLLGFTFRTQWKYKSIVFSVHTINKMFSLINLHPFNFKQHETFYVTLIHWLKTGRSNECIECCYLEQKIHAVVAMSRIIIFVTHNAATYQVLSSSIEVGPDFRYTDVMSMSSTCPNSNLDLFSPYIFVPRRRFKTVTYNSNSSINTHYDSSLSLSRSDNFSFL